MFKAVVVKLVVKVHRLLVHEVFTNKLCPLEPPPTRKIEPGA